MDTTKIMTHALGSILSTYWWLIPVFLILAFLKSPFMKGVLGEFIVNLGLITLQGTSAKLAFILFITGQSS
jgi:hypothetical protein